VLCSEVKAYKVEKGEEFTLKPKVVVSEMTQDMLLTGTWCVLRSAFIDRSVG